MSSQRKILHAADIHLDSPLQKLGSYEHAPVERIRGASRRALENLVQLAVEEAVDLVVIAGDLYDGDWPDQNTGLFFVAQASKLVKAGIPLAVIRGNHDAANIMTSSLPLPKNPDGSEIMLAADRVDQRIFESIGVAVHGRSFRTRAETENLAADYPLPNRGLFNLGLLHTSLTGAEGHDPYAPCTPAQLAEKDYDYWALGHVHTRGEHGIEGAAPVVFSGNIQGRHIREVGPKGCILLDIDARNNCTRTFRELDVVRWQMCQIELSDLQHVDEINDRFQDWLVSALADADGRMLVVRVELIGATRLNHEIRKQQSGIKASLQAIAVTHGHDQVWMEDLKCHTSVPNDQTVTLDLDGPLESLSTVISQFKESDDSAKTIEHELRSLLKKMPQELVGPNMPIQTEDPQWIADLIESASAEVLGRLQTEGAEL
ncbi:MAG: metallophosphoesterase family protein [Rubripirellula sp.]